MSEVLPFSDAEQRQHYADGGGGDGGQIPLTCRLQDTGNFCGQGGGKRPPKLGEIGRSKRGELVIEDERIEAVLTMSEKAAPAV